MSGKAKVKVAKPPALFHNSIEFTDEQGNRVQKYLKPNPGSQQIPDFNEIELMAGLGSPSLGVNCPSGITCDYTPRTDQELQWQCTGPDPSAVFADNTLFAQRSGFTYNIKTLWEHNCVINLYRKTGTNPKTNHIQIPTKQHLEDSGISVQSAHEVYDNEYLFGDSGTVQMVDYQREDASYGGMQTDRGFIGFNPNMGYYDHSSASIPYVLLSACLLVLICVCCCVAITVSFIAGNATMWFAAERKENAKYEAIGNISS
eukprot:250068_1